MDILTSYGQTTEDVDEMLQRVSTDGNELKFVIHGHDRDEDGYFIEGENQFCPVIFGAPDANKRFLVLDLSQRYDALTLAESGALRHLY
ncbi:MAG: hypothetical protein R3E66_02645 [bacterium]